MLISFKLENWMSFSDQITFSMVASRERQHGERVPKLSKYQTRVLPIAAIYGGNAAGKTNFFKALSFAIGIYLPLSTTLPIFIGGAIRGIVDGKKKKQEAENNGEEEDLRKGNLFATGLVAGGAIAGVIVAFLSANENIARMLKKVNLEEILTHQLGEQGYFILGSILFFTLAFILYKVAMSKEVANNETV
jgi:hypothetical protein